MDIDPGTVVANRYRISHPLGRGGMGEVFAAENIRTGRPVAVKLLRSDSKTKSSAVARFRQEARAAGSINSDHVTQVLDVEEDNEHGVVLVFELLEGESLIDRLKRTGPIPFDELHAIIEQVWMGLADAHRVGIIHRDLKPSNVFLERRPDGTTRVKILDFGISKLPKEMGGETLTEMGQSLGTFSFMPPEQIGKAKTVDHRADIYACATMIYQSLTGQLPYSARNILVMVEMKSKTDARKLAEAMGGPVDPRLEAFVSQGLARDPSKRFQSAVEALGVWRELRPPPRSAAQEPSGRRQGIPPSQRLPPSRRMPPSPHMSAQPSPPALDGAAATSGPRGAQSPKPSAVAPGTQRGVPAAQASGGAGLAQSASPPGTSPELLVGPPTLAEGAAPPGQLIAELTTDSAATVTMLAPAHLAEPDSNDDPPVEPPAAAARSVPKPAYDTSSPAALGFTGATTTRIQRPASLGSSNARGASSAHSQGNASGRAVPNSDRSPSADQNAYEASKAGNLPPHPAGYYIPPAVAASLAHAREKENAEARSEQAIEPGGLASRALDPGGLASRALDPSATLQRGIASSGLVPTPATGGMPMPSLSDDSDAGRASAAEQQTHVYRPRAPTESSMTIRGDRAVAQPKRSSRAAFLFGALAFLVVGFVIVALIMRYISSG